MFGLTPYDKRGEFLFPTPHYNINQMAVDIKENEKEYIVEAELPGVNKDEINIELRDERLTISVEKKEETTDKRDNYIRKERHYGFMTRSFYVDNVNPEEVSARFENGILKITLPKKQKDVPKGKKIDIN